MGDIWRRICGIDGCLWCGCMEVRDWDTI
jgi:hypothetical protein